MNLLKWKQVILTVCILCFLLPTMQVSAAEQDTVTYCPEVIAYEDCLFLNGDEDKYNPDNYEFLYYVDMGNSVSYYENFGYQTYYMVYSHVPVIFCKNNDDGHLYVFATEEKSTDTEIMGYIRCQFALGTETKSSQGSSIMEKGVAYREGAVDFFAEKIKGYYTNDPNGLLVFDSVESARNYIDNGSLDGQLIKRDVEIDASKSNYDENFHLLNFHGNSSIQCYWTGVSQQSHLAGYDTQKYIKIIAGYGYKAAPGQIAETVILESNYGLNNHSYYKPVQDLKHSNEDYVLRYIRFVPIYLDYGSGNGYYGKSSYIYFNPNGSIESVDTSVVSGIVSHDTEIGYLQKVVYYNGTVKGYEIGKDVPYAIVSNIKWDTSLQFDNLHIELRTKGNYTSGGQSITSIVNILDYSNNILYDDGLIQFSHSDVQAIWAANISSDVVSENVNITEYYIRGVLFDEATDTYRYGGWTRIDTQSMLSNNITTGGMDSVTGDFVADNISDDSYSYGVDSDGKGNYEPIDMDDFNLFEDEGIKWFYNSLKSIMSQLGSFPSLVNTVFGFLPGEYIKAIGFLLTASVIMRILGR